MICRHHIMYFQLCTGQPGATGFKLTDLNCLDLVRGEHDAAGARSS